MQPSEPLRQESVSRTAKIGFYTVGSLLAGVGLLTVPFLRRYGGAPYVASAPAARAAVRSFLVTYRRSLPKAPPPRLTDLGSGSGELVLQAAEAGFDARGVELNWWLVLRARLRARGLPLSALKHARFERRDMWTCGLQQEDVVLVFGVPGMMKRVGHLAASECKGECVVCCNTFPIPGWVAFRKRGGVWFYRVGDQNNSSSKGLIKGA